MTHPLTNKVLVDLYQKTLAKRSQEGDRTATFPVDFMRAAADWQLEQVIEWLEGTECNQIFQGRVVFAEDLKKAMRPQESSD